MNSILVIEDEPQIRHNLQEILNLWRFETNVAPNGLIGIDMAQQILPDLIICDITMPELDGHDVIRILRQDETTANIPFIFLTALGETAQRRQGMELGAADYLTKPFKPEELKQAVKTQLRKRENIAAANDRKLNLLRSNINLSLPHELHTPLNGIIGSAEFLIRDHELMPLDDRLELAHQIRNSALRLYDLTRDFLLYAELEMIASSPDRAKAIERNRKQANLPCRIVTSIAEKLARQYSRSADLYVEIQNHPIPMGEPKFSKMMEKLIDNAFKFSVAGSPVQIVGRCVDDTYYLNVIDMGCGMDATQIDQIGAYMQFDRQRYGQSGTGLGLAIAKHLIELHGGEMSIRSLVNQETIVHLTLPVKPD
jgi:two-component system, sensor histidine kinase and response regulator